MLDSVISYLSFGLAVAAITFTYLSYRDQHLKPFTPVFLVGEPTLRFLRYDQEIECFDGTARKIVTWAPFAQLTLRVLNDGAKPGQIADFRLSFRSERLTYALLPSYSVNKQALETVDKSRKAYDPFEFQRAIQDEEWAGFLIPRGESLGGELMFECNSAGFRELPRGTFRVVLEYTTEGSAWLPIREWEGFNWGFVDEERLAKGQPYCHRSDVGGDRVWPKDWKDEENLSLDDEIWRLVEGEDSK